MSHMTREQLVQELLLRFRTVFHGVRSGIRFPLHAHDLSGAEITIMMRLGQKPHGISVKDLAAEMGITSGAVTQFIDKLVEKDLVERVEDPNDRRSIQILPSAKARQLRDNLKEQFHSRMAAIFDSLSNKDLEQFIALLSKIKIEQNNEV